MTITTILIQEIIKNLNIMSNEEHNEYEENNAEAYYESLKPEEVILWFNDMNEFKQWVETGTPEQIGWALEDFEKAELYEHCAVIMEVLREKNNPGTII